LMLSSAFAFIAAVDAIAQPITVRAGDHEGFTRVVMQLPSGAEWRVEEEFGLKKIFISNHEDGFNISRMFNVISREIISNATGFRSRLDLGVTCDCSINTFVARNNYLVVDIFDGPDLPSAPVEQAARFISARPASSFNFGDLLWADVDGVTDELYSGENSQTDDLNEADNNSPSSSVVERELVEKTRQQLVLDLGRAASRGILEPAVPNIAKRTDIDAVQPPLPAQATSEKDTVPIIAGDGNIRITTSRTKPLLPGTVDLMMSGAVCAGSEQVSVSSWGRDEPLSVQLGDLRSQLFSDIDGLNLNVAKELAQLYIHFGYGAEAKQVLLMADELVARNPALLDISDILEYGYTRNPRFVHRFLDCDSELALWSAMAAQRLPPDQVVNENAALRALANLPDNLKLILAPALSRRFADAGHLESAAIALRNVDFKQNNAVANVALAEAEIEKQLGSIENAQDRLENVLQDNVAETPEAIIAYVETQLSKAQKIPPDISLLVETYAFERREGPLARDLLRSHVIASSYSDQFSKAFDALGDKRVINDPVFLMQLQSIVFSALGTEADDISFLEGYFSHHPENSLEIDPKAIEIVASRLLKLGFPEESIELISGDTAPDDISLPHALIYAEALLNVSRPNDALLVLSSMKGENVKRLRGLALLQLGENETAFDIFKSEEAREETIRSAWLSNDWVDLLPLNTPVLGQAISLVGEPIDRVENEIGMLQFLDTAIQESSEARAALGSILSGVTVVP
ncbi:MAG: hypothetical protein ABJP82_11835, partial [Hyphomicrobiales bacterium]